MPQLICSKMALYRKVAEEGSHVGAGARGDRVTLAQVGEEALRPSQIGRLRRRRVVRKRSSLRMLPSLSFAGTARSGLCFAPSSQARSSRNSWQ